MLYIWNLLQVYFLFVLFCKERLEIVYIHDILFIFTLEKEHDSNVIFSTKMHDWSEGAGDHSKSMRRLGCITIPLPWNDSFWEFLIYNCYVCTRDSYSFSLMIDIVTNKAGASFSIDTYAIKCEWLGLFQSFFSYYVT